MGAVDEVREAVAGVVELVVVLEDEVLQRWRCTTYGLTSFNIVRVTSSQEMENAHLVLYLAHLTLTGASTLIKRKNGRRSKASSTFSLHIPLMIHLSLHRVVTKSSSASTVAKVRLS